MRAAWSGDLVAAGDGSPTLRSGYGGLPLVGPNRLSPGTLTEHLTGEPQRSSSLASRRALQIQLTEPQRLASDGSTGNREAKVPHQRTSPLLAMMPVVDLLRFCTHTTLKQCRLDQTIREHA